MAEINGKKVLFSVHAHTTTPTSAGDISYDPSTSGLEATDVQAAVDEVKAKVDTKADTDGSYEGMTVGNAEQLISKVGLSDKSPYLFRTAGGSLEIGNRSKVKKIIGGSLPIINGVHNGNFADKTGWYCTDGSSAWSVANNKATMTWTPSYTRNGLYQDVGFITGHKYLVSCTIKNLTESANYFIIGQPYVSGGSIYVAIGAGQTKTLTGFLTPTIVSGSGYELTIGLMSTSSNTCSIEISKVYCIDVTATFGTTVANRLYALEQAQAGTGIAKAKEILVKDYYPYNVTDFTHTKTSGKVNNGFNQWDEQWESGRYNNTTGAKEAGDGTRIRNKNPIPALPNTVYYRPELKVSNVYFYDENGNYIDYASSGVVGTFTTPSNCAFICFFTVAAYGTTYKNDICINLHWDGERDGEYEPYQEWNYPVQDIELKGILSLDAQDNWVANGDEYLPSGVVDVNVNEYTILGTETVFASQFDGVNDYVILVVPTIMGGTIVNLPNTINNAKSVTNSGTAGNHYLAITFNEGIYNDLASAITAITGKKAIIPLDTPTTSSATPYTELQNDSNWGTEKWIDTRDVPMPVFSETEYLLDVLAKVEAAPESPTADGDYVMHRANGKNTYTSIASWLSSNGYAPNVVPTAPTTDGNYVLKCTIANGVATYSWEAQS